MKVFALPSALLSISFNPEVVFSSLTNFLGSGYTILIIAAIVAFGLIKKVVKLLFLAAFVFAIWLLCSSGAIDSLLHQIQTML